MGQSEIKIHCVYDQMIDVAELRPNPRNPNKHPQKQIELLAKIIEEQGWRAPITVSNRSGLVVRGHGRLEAAKRLDLKQAPVDFQDYDSDAQELADLVADNKIAELSELQIPLLSELLQGLKEQNFDLDLIAFSKQEIDRLLHVEKSVDESLAVDVLPTYKIIITCDNETHQKELLQIFIESELKCQALIL